MLKTIIYKDDFTLLIIILLIGKGKSLLFLALVYLLDSRVIVVIILYQALLNQLLVIVQVARINSFKQKSSEINLVVLIFVSVNIVVLVFVSVDIVVLFLSYTQIIESKGLLQQVFVDESYLMFIASNQYIKLIIVQQI